ncbi:A1 cistron-splicing factor [Halteromyces radiatus]|uniref:A1 cistron-splicing factor n=1 Tax=Halteromyces radiatus TaxID=101107 RepID=UPI0022212A87|nr:A1 cistron-splicing factor [Halteromyces radiatus]KAI8097592.1 A1 cistron-splicing factor [Halteromyces radiatus]
MDQETANQLYDVGGKLLFLNAPERLEFGIDYNAWTIGPLFKGVKLIPPGLHFIYFSTTSKEGIQGIRTGFFKYFDTGEIVVREWNPKIEDLYGESELDPSQVERYIINIRDFDRNMGPYPLDPPTYYQRWQHLTNHITPGLVKRILPNNGRVSHLPAVTPAVENEEPEASTTSAAATAAAATPTTTIRDRRKGQGIEKEEGMEFTPFDLRQSFPSGATGDQVTKWSLDKSWLVKDLLQRVYRGDHRLLLGEMQLAFVCLLMAQNFSGFQQWKQIVHLLCSCHEMVHDHPTLFVDFLDTLQQQLEECPVDFFRDILSENNFIASMLKNLRDVIPPSSTALYTKFNKMKQFLSTRFQWELPDQADEDEEEEDDDAPVVVDLENPY